MNFLAKFEKHNPLAPFIKGKFYQFNISTKINLIQVVIQNITGFPSKGEFRGLFIFSFPFLLTPIPYLLVS